MRVPTALIRADNDGVRRVSDAAVEKWRHLTQSDLEIAEVQGAHTGPENYILDEPNVQAVAREFLNLIQKG